MMALPRLNAADGITAVRLIATPLFVGCVLQARQAAGFGWVAGFLFALAAWSDVADGRVARRRGTQSDQGRVLDHFADIVFILVALGTYVHLGIAPWWVPASIAVSFGVYVVDSWLRSTVRPALIGSRLGHAGGVANYVLIGVLVFNESTGLRWLPPGVVGTLFMLVPLYSGAAIATRLSARSETVVHPLHQR